MRITTLLSALLLLPLTSAFSQQRDLEVRAGIIGLLSERNATLGGAAGTADGTHLGGEISVRWRSFLGASARLLGGEFSANGGTEAVGEVHNGEVDVFAGPRYLQGHLGYGLRSFTGAFGTQRWSYLRFGGRSKLPLGDSGFEASLAVTLYVAVSARAGTLDGSGREGETRLTYAPERFPFKLELPAYLFLGYRFEQFTVEAEDEDRPEEIGSVLLGAGVRLRF